LTPFQLIFLRLRAEESHDAKTLWPVTCFSLLWVRKNMSDADAHTQTPQYAVAGDQTAVRELQRVLSLYLPSFYRCALRVLGNRDDAEDAVQEALLAAHKHLHQFRGQSQMSTWLTTIVCNCARMQLRKRPRQVHMPLEEQLGGETGYFIFEEVADARPSPEDECRNSELTALLRQCVAQLSPKLRRTFQLRVVDGLSTLETAQVLGVPLGTVKAQMARARAGIARHMRRVLAPSRRTRLSAAARVFRLVERRDLVEQHPGSAAGKGSENANHARVLLTSEVPKTKGKFDSASIAQKDDAFPVLDSNSVPIVTGV
jgi:RNA polymerase sigma-70 factor (ECF subfamily)